MANNLIFLTSAHGQTAPIYAIHLPAIGDITLKGLAGANKYIAWSEGNAGAYMQTPLVYVDYLYSCQINGVLSCYEANTGKRMY